MATFDYIAALCRNDYDLSESELVSKLRATDIDPSVLSERYGAGGETLLHLAVYEGRSPEFCRVLHELDITLVKTTNDYGMLPIHRCYDVEVAKYLFNVYPESINLPDSTGRYPIHYFATTDRRVKGSNDQLLQLLTFLLKHDNGAVSTPSIYGELPLYNACLGSACWGRGLAFVKLLFDAHPDAIFVQDGHGLTPMELARSNNQADVVHFLETQLRFHRRSQDDQDPDINGQLPLHRVLESEDVSLGAIKLMVGAHRASVAVADNRGCIPLHYACRIGDLNIVKYLVEGNEYALQIRNSLGEFPLHVACRHGRCNVINYILEKSNLGVSVVNAKKLPIQALLFDANCDRDSLEFVEAVGRLLSAHPVNPSDLVKKED
eukprot:scaffold3715_cov60-Cyclotella_meneghiniana.AAC.3